MQDFGQESFETERPLADKMRPSVLDEYAGQEHLLGEGKPLRNLLTSGVVPSCCLYGPPGVGKTTLARLMARVTGREFLEINAVSATVATLRELLARAADVKERTGKTAIAFIDEIYHFNTKQQNVLLPYVEKGDLILVGTTTENPYFEINKTLLSRMIVYTLKPLNEENILKVLERALTDEEKGLGKLHVTTEDGVLEQIATASGGDARQALTRLETAVVAVAMGGGSHLTMEALASAVGGNSKRYDKKSDDHYEVISALIKSLRGSDPDAALYWMARMIEAGDDLHFITRRLCIFAAEDVGLADPFALVLAQNVAAAVDRVGYPEASIILGEAVVYLASAPKSNSAYKAIAAAISSVNNEPLMEVPLHLRNNNDEIKNYKYPHDYPGHWVAQSYTPEVRRFYFPEEAGTESKIAARLRGLWKRYEK